MYRSCPMGCLLYCLQFNDTTVTRLFQMGGNAPVLGGSFARAERRCAASIAPRSRGIIRLVPPRVRALPVQTQLALHGSKSTSMVVIRGKET